MLYKAYHILLLAQFAVINTVLHKTRKHTKITVAHKTNLRAVTRASQSLFLA